MTIACGDLVEYRPMSDKLICDKIIGRVLRIDDDSRFPYLIEDPGHDQPWWVREAEVIRVLRD